MVKMLVVSSDTLEADQEAAYMIKQEMKTDQALEKIVWYSKIGSEMSSMDSRMMDLEKKMKEHVAQMKCWQDDTRRRLKGVEADVCECVMQVEKKSKENR